MALDNSVVDEMTAGPIVAVRVIEFNPATEAVKTWDEIFHVKERWTRDVLDEPTFMQWLWDFRNFCLAAGFQPAGDGDIIDAVKRYEHYVSGSGFRDLAFLKAAVFRLLVHRCVAGCQRILPILRDLVGVRQPAALNAA